MEQKLREEWKWRTNVKRLGHEQIEGPSLYRIMLELEAKLNHPVQVYENTGLILHAKTGETVGKINKVRI